MVYQKYIDKARWLKTIMLTEGLYNFNNNKRGTAAIAYVEKISVLHLNNIVATHAKEKQNKLNKGLIDSSFNNLSTRSPIPNHVESSYIRAIHSIITVTYIYFSLLSPYVEYILPCIQQMKYFICITYRDPATNTTNTSTRGTILRHPSE